MFVKKLLYWRIWFFLVALKILVFGSFFFYIFFNSLVEGFIWAHLGFFYFLFFILYFVFSFFVFSWFLFRAAASTELQQSKILHCLQKKKDIFNQLSTWQSTWKTTWKTTRKTALWRFRTDFIGLRKGYIKLVSFYHKKALFLLRKTLVTEWCSYYLLFYIERVVIGYKTLHAMKIFKLQMLLCTDPNDWIYLVGFAQL
jgi:hypothetical protein